MLKYSLGGGAGRENYQSELTTINLPTTPSSAPISAPATELHRDIYFAFGELAIPIISPDQNIAAMRKLDVNLASRWSHYSDFGDNVSSKAGIAWFPVDSFKLRATISQFFRAPYLTQLDPSSNSITITHGSDLGPDFASALDAFTGTPNSNLIAAAGNNPILKPESGVSRTVGFDFAPTQMPSLKLGFTYYHFDYNHRIAVPDPSYEGFVSPAAVPYAFIVNPTVSQVAGVLTGISPSQIYVNDVVPNPKNLAALAAATNAIYDNRLQNISRVVLDAIDLDASYSHPLVVGTINFALHASYLPSYNEHVAPGAPEQSLVGNILMPSDLKGRASALYTIGGFSGGVAINYVNGYRNSVAVGAPSVANWTTVDTTLAYEFSSGTGLLNGLHLLLSVQNLLDTNPPFVPISIAGNGGFGIATSTGYDPVNANPIGRLVNLTISKRW
jgi:hypothetical protein